MWRMFVIAITVAGCPLSTPTDDDTDPPDDTLSWFTTCGDPVCSGYSGPYLGVDACTAEVEGDACGVADERCDFLSACNATLVCAEVDPKAQPGGCPISHLRYKTDVVYLEPEDKESLRKQALEAEQEKHFQEQRVAACHSAKTNLQMLICIESRNDDVNFGFLHL